VWGGTVYDSPSSTSLLKREDDQYTLHYFKKKRIIFSPSKLNIFLITLSLDGRGKPRVRVNKKGES
jgi:hypothetical protein